MSSYFDGWRRAFSFSGTSTRAQFWIFNIVNAVLIYLVYYLMLADAIANGGETTALTGSLSLFFLVFTIPYVIASWSIAVRRLHDIGKSGWSLLLGVIPIIGSIILLVYYLSSSE